MSKPKKKTQASPSIEAPIPEPHSRLDRSYQPTTDSTIEAPKIVLDCERPCPNPTNAQTMTLWSAQGIACRYAKFKAGNPVPPSFKKEPVYELKLESLEQKYKVDYLLYTPHGLIFGCEGEVDIVPLGNVAYVRTI